MNRIKMNGITFDPRETLPIEAAATSMANDATDSNYILIQTKAPLTSE